VNIFFLDYNIGLSTEYHCDRHVVKMVTEYAQLLSTAHHLHGNNIKGIYRPTHTKHPSTIWTATSKQNYRGIACGY